MNVETISTLGAMLASIIAAIIGHFVSIGRLKDKMHELQIELEKLKHRDDVQQIIIDELTEFTLMARGIVRNVNKKIRLK